MSKKILDRFCLMRNGIQNRTSEFMLSCIFTAMQGQLNDALLKWNVSKKSKVAVSSKVQYLLDRIRDVLKAGYKPYEAEQEQENKDVDSTTPQSNLYNIADDEYDEI